MYPRSVILIYCHSLPQKILSLHPLRLPLPSLDCTSFGQTSSFWTSLVFGLLETTVGNLLPTANFTCMYELGSLLHALGCEFPSIARDHIPVPCFAFGLTLLGQLSYWWLLSGCFFSKSERKTSCWWFTSLFWVII